MQSEGTQSEDEAGGEPDPQTLQRVALSKPCTRSGGPGRRRHTRPRDRGYRYQSVDDTVPDLAGQVDHAKSARPATSTAFPNQDPAAWRWMTNIRHARGRVDAAKHDGVGVDCVNPTLRIAAINVASRNGGYFT